MQPQRSFITRAPTAIACSLTAWLCACLPPCMRPWRPHLWLSACRRAVMLPGGGMYVSNSSVSPKHSTGTSDAPACSATRAKPLRRARICRQGASGSRQRSGARTGGQQAASQQACRHAQQPLQQLLRVRVAACAARHARRLTRL